MNAQDIMTAQVTTVSPDTPVREVAAVLFHAHISAVPVVDGAQLVGIISEADLLHRYEIGTDCASGEGPWWIRLFSADASPEEYVKSHARFARDVMTRDVATVAPQSTLAEIATLLEKRRIKRVPVLDAGRLVGIVSRSDLVRVLAATQRAAADPASMSDEAIRTLLLSELRRQAWWHEDFANVTVEDGVVTYGGVVRAENERPAARAAAETVPGVRRVVDTRLAYGSLPSMV